MQPQTIIFYGPSGAGKGTQAKLLKEYFEKHDTARKTISLTTGDGLRTFVEESDTYTSKRTKEVIDTGGLLPSFIPIWIWTDALIKSYTGDEHIIWDGTRRRIEVSVLDTVLCFFKRAHVHVIVLNVSEEWSVEKLKDRGRHDDIDKDIQERLSWYESDVIPAINFFRDHKDYPVHDVQGEQTIQEVHKEILEKLNLTPDT